MNKHGKKGEHEEETNEKWLLPYSDLMTLLLAVFIVLYAVSMRDSHKMAEMAQAFRGIFSGETSVMEEAGDSGLIDTVTSSNDSDAVIIDIQNQQPSKTGEGGEGKNREQLENFKDALKTYLLQNNVTGNIGISDESGILTLTLTLASDVLFPRGSAKLNDSQREMARRVAELMDDTQQRGLKMQVKILGYTDNMPINTAQYPSNWNLSLDRATNFLAAMLEGSNLDPRVFSVVGCGEMDPVDTNDTTEGQQRNRRVEVQFTCPDDSAIDDIDSLLRPSK